MIDLWRAACESPAICRQIGGFLCYPEQTVSQADRTLAKAAEHELAVRQLLELSSPLSVRISEIATGWLWPGCASAVINPDCSLAIFRGFEASFERSPWRWGEAGSNGYH
jgi:hypothetical protein